ncbi:expressed unknown protein [Seminavis robusta]|uniref:Uncharacterized protein n=1 Tax=Seminavis robusta TaxID=568900 RepID=A0A9N8EWS0_9STRA|nr:expressed unknown protein [Seminavis robusta]|eukprot:Sro1988_g309640.1 n/a (631) ;mRNA; r:8896-10788
MRNLNSNYVDDCVASAEERARDLLTARFSADRWFTAPISRNDHFQILSILKEFPRLTSTRIQVRYPGDNRTTRVSPLRLLVEGQADLDIIEAVYELNPSMLSSDFDLINILRRACEYRAPTPVVEYVSLKFPKTLTDTCYQQMALVHALQDTPGRSKSSLETIQLLLKICPKSVNYMNRNGDTALDFAIMNGYGLPVIKTILDVMKQQSCEIASFSMPRRWELTLDAQAAESINMILLRSATKSNKKPLQCHPALWTQEGFTRTMESLASHKDGLSSIKLDLPCLASNVPERLVREGLSRLCSNDCEIEDLELIAPHSSPDLVDAILPGLDPGPGRGSGLRKLVLKDVDSLGLEPLAAFFASKAAPKIVNILSCQLVDDNSQISDTISFCSSPTERLEFKDSFLAPLGISWLLHRAATMPVLRELHLIAPTEFAEQRRGNDAEIPVDPLVALLNNNVLQSLGIAGYIVKPEPFYQALMFNTSLRKYRYTNKKGYAPDRLEKIFRKHKILLASVMEHSNVTLTDPYVGHRIGMPVESNAFGATRQRPSSSSSGFCKIDYYKALNKFGRKTARDPTESVEIVVELLSDVVVHRSFPCLDPLQKHNLQYGLLRESVSIWSPKEHWTNALNFES